MKRFLLINNENAQRVLGDNWQSILGGTLGLTESVLVDTNHCPPREVGSDFMAPEDARFTRDLSWVAEELNQLNTEILDLRQVLLANGHPAFPVVLLAWPRVSEPFSAEWGRSG